jgi:pimeloyl-ACP methyl ester carboxylesterase
VGTLLVNPGGPGASGIDDLRAGGPRARLADRFDVVAWDPRGTGGSTRLDCDEGSEEFRALDPSPDDPGEQQALDEAAAALAAACTAADPDLLANLDATVVARDLDLLRRALGEEQISFAGYSYGTLLGLEYARAFPGRVRALVLDGVVDPGQAPAGLLEEQAAAIEPVLRSGLADCDGCVLDDPVAAYDAVAARVEREPLPSETGRPVGPARLTLAAIAATYRTDGPEVLAEALADAEHGDGTALDRLAAGYDGAVASFMTYVATVCADGPHPLGAGEAAAFADRLARISPWFGAAIANEVLPCAFWTVPPGRVPTPITPDDPAGVVPTLVIGTTGDVATPYATAERVAAALPGAVLLTHVGGGHTASGRDRCVDDAVRRFLVDLEPPEPGTRCPD